MGAWLSSAAGAILWKYLRVVGPTLRCVLKVPRSEIQDPLEALRASVFSASTRPAFVALWTTDHINLLAFAFAATELKQIARDLAFLVDDSLGGRIVKEVLKRENLTYISIRTTDAAGRLKDLRALLELRTPLVLVVDGHGPYFEVGTGLLTLAKMLEGAIWPCAARARRSLLVPNAKVRLQLPTFFSELAVTLGDPIMCRPEDSAADLASILRRRMEAARTPP